MQEQGKRCKELCDPAVFERLFDQLSPKIYRYAFLRLSAQEDAEDVLSETFLRMWNYVQRNPNRILEHANAFVYRIARNLIIDQYRARIPQISLDVLLESGFELPAYAKDNPEKKTEYALVLQFISKLKDADRDLILLRYVDSISVIEIAEMYGIGENAASVRIHRALQKLKDLVRGDV